MNNNTRLKIILVPATLADVGAASMIANRLAGIDYNFFSLDKPIGSLRILEFTWNSNFDIELWDICGADSYKTGLPAVAFMDATGMVIVSGDVPRTLLERNNGFFGSSDFPILWFVDENTYRYSAQEMALSGLNLMKVHFGGASEEIISVEFNNWIGKVLTYLNAKQHHSQHHY